MCVIYGCTCNFFSNARLHASLYEEMDVDIFVIELKQKKKHVHTIDYAACMEKRVDGIFGFDLRFLELS